MNEWMNEWVLCTGRKTLKGKPEHPVPIVLCHHKYIQTGQWLNPCNGSDMLTTIKPTHSTAPSGTRMNFGTSYSKASNNHFTKTIMTRAPACSVQSIGFLSHNFTVRYEVFIVILLKIQVPWDVMLGHWVKCWAFLRHYNASKSQTLLTQQRSIASQRTLIFCIQNVTQWFINSVWTEMVHLLNHLWTPPHATCHTGSYNFITVLMLTNKNKK